jgi:hypothetical protein
VKITRMRIPVFVSCPTNLSPEQEASAQIIMRLLKKNKLEWRALGRSDYPRNLPLREVLRLIKHCSGGLILGFEQFRAPSGVHRRGTSKEEEKDSPIVMPTPWNHLEAGILFNQKLPLLIFREPGVEGGIFDLGITDVFIHMMPTPGMSREASDDLDTVFQVWASEVRHYYYED